MNERQVDLWVQSLMSEPTPKKKRKEKAVSEPKFGPKGLTLEEVAVQFYLWGGSDALPVDAGPDEIDKLPLLGRGLTVGGVSLDRVRAAVNSRVAERAELAAEALGPWPVVS